VKSSKAEIHAKYHKIPRLRYCEERKLTSYSGLVIFQALFHSIKLRTRLRLCFSHLKNGKIFGHASIMLLLIVHVMLGFRRLRGLDYYRDDPLVARVCGIRKLPDVGTVSRTLSSFDEESVDNLRDLTCEMVIDRLRKIRPQILTIDFDGSVQSTSGHAEGTAVGFNKKKKGARSYYPLFATIAQTSQFFGMHHRPGNVHDSNGAIDFIAQTLYRLAGELPGVQLESRIDSAFYDKRIFYVLDKLDSRFTCSLPFERFPKFKAIIEARQRWRRIDKELSYFESNWKPDKWPRQYRVLVIRKRSRKHEKGPVQLDLFTPVEHGYEYKTIATNMTGAAADILLFHNGRGSQEKLFGEAKQHAALDVIPTRRKIGNQVFTLAGMLAHNLGRELQMATRPADRDDLEKRPAKWRFDSLGTIRQHLLHNAGTLTRPQGELTLTMNSNDVIREELSRYLDGLMKNAA
jgi:DDE family transposase